MHSHFCVVGMGGVGSWAAEALARSGVGAITLIDGDEVCITNTNRQLHATQQNIGQAKVAVMAQRIVAINPACCVQVINQFATPENLAALISPKVSYVIDAVDSVMVK